MPRVGARPRDDRGRPRLDRRHARARARALPRRARDRAGERRHGRRQQRRHARAPAATGSCCSTRTPGCSATGSSGWSRSRESHPDAAVVGPRLRNPDGTLQRSVRGEPTLWRLATEYLFIRKLAPRSRRLNAFYAGDFDHDEVREVESLHGRRAARAARGDRRGRAVRRGVLHVQRGDRLAAPLPRGRLEGAVLPGRRGRRTSAAPRTAAGCTSRTCAASCASSPSTAAGARPSGRGSCCSWSLRLRGLVFRGERGQRYRDGARFLASGDVGSLLA